MSTLVMIYTGIGFLLFMICIPFKKRSILIKSAMLGVSFLVFDSTFNITNLFVVDLHTPIALDEPVTKFLTTNNIPAPVFKRNRFLSTELLNIKGTEVVLPANYPSLTKGQLNYILIEYINTQLVSPSFYEQVLEREKQIAESKAKKEKTHFLAIAKPFELRRVGLDSKKRVANIKENKGEESCFINTDTFTNDCTFTSAEELNFYPFRFWDKAAFEANLENDFTKVAGLVIKNKRVYPNKEKFSISLREPMFN